MSTKQVTKAKINFDFIPNPEGDQVFLHLKVKGKDVDTVYRFDVVDFLHLSSDVKSSYLTYISNL